MFNIRDQAGFEPPKHHPLGRERHTVMLAELIAIIALAISTLTVAAVVSIGVAHAGY
jgi:hypothetical protein